MNFEMRLNALELLISELRHMEPIQRLQTYSTIKTFLDEIEAYVIEHESENLDHGNAGIYIAEMYSPLETIVGLDNNGHEESSNFGWLETGIDKLRSVHCFNIYKY